MMPRIKCHKVTLRTVNIVQNIAKEVEEEPLSTAEEALKVELLSPFVQSNIENHIRKKYAKVCDPAVNLTCKKCTN